MPRCGARRCRRCAALLAAAPACHRSRSATRTRRSSSAHTTRRELCCSSTFSRRPARSSCGAAPSTTAHCLAAARRRRSLTGCSSASCSTASSSSVAARRTASSTPSATRWRWCFLGMTITCTRPSVGQMCATRGGGTARRTSAISTPCPYLRDCRLSSRLLRDSLKTMPRLLNRTGDNPCTLTVRLEDFEHDWARLRPPERLLPPRRRHISRARHAAAGHHPGTALGPARRDRLRHAAAADACIR